MQRGGPSSERTPLVAPSYVFESSMSRRFKRRLHTFQCCLCVGLLAILGVSLLISISFVLDEENRAQKNNDSEVTTERASNLSLAYSLSPLLQLSWPRPDSAPGKWVGDAAPVAEVLAAADARGEAALASRRRLEAAGGGGSLRPDTPAARAQQASATAADTVQPLADTAYATEHATLALTNRSAVTVGFGSVGRGPPSAGPWPLPPYCATNPPPCPRARYRTFNGSCNNPEHPLRWGVAFTPFRRALPPDYADGVSAPRVSVNGAPLPSAREVSVTVHRPSYSRDSSFTVMLAVWGQFLDHDITATAISKGVNGSSISCCGAAETPGLRPHPECFPVRLAPADPTYRTYNLTCMEFVRAAPAPTCYYGPREQLNQMTSFIDGSVVYGSSEERASRLRTHRGGRLRMLRVTGQELLPHSTDPHDGCNTRLMNAQGKYCFMAGDARANENLHLTTMHLLWAREHNRVASQLQRLNPRWHDDALFHETRRIVAAQMQHITYNEFLPIVLGADLMESLNISVRSTGSYVDVYNSSVDPSVANHFAASAFRFAHTLLPGVMHATDAATGSEEYVLLHTMLFNPYSLYSVRGPELALSSALGTGVHRVRAHVTGELSDHLFERTDNTSGTLKTQGPCGLDLVSLNIQRGRDHGLPGYPAWREHCGLGRPRGWRDLHHIFDDQSLARIRSIYSSVDDIDLYTGALSEDPGGRLLGPTLSCLIADQFLRLKVADRFWYETSERLVAFSHDQLLEIRKTSLAGVICANAAGLHSAQAQVMQEVSDDNPLRPCADIPQLDFAAWTVDN